MPPKAKLNREKIIESALAEVRAEGMEALNARSLAKKLDCSTTPIFSCFRSMEEVKDAVVKKALELYTAFIEAGLAEESRFKGAGKGYIRFAREEPELFKLIFMTPKQIQPGLPDVDPNYDKVAAAAAFSSGLSEKKVQRLYFELWIFVHGIAVMIATKTLDFTEAEIGDMLTDCFLGIKNKLEKDE